MGTSDEALRELRGAIRDNDFGRARVLLADPALAARLNDARFECGKPALIAARSREMVDVLLEKGANVDRVSEFWAPGFWLNDTAEDIGEYLAERGAQLTPHAAAALGLVDRLHDMLEADPSLIESKGGDGCRPLHFARGVWTASLLIELGAELDPLDDDHRSTPSQWRIGDAPEVSRLLIEKGAKLDIFLAVGLHDLELAKEAIRADPGCTGYRIGNNGGPFPGIGFEGRGGTILQWSLGFNVSPQEVALKRGQREIYDYLMERTAPRPKLLAACMVGDEGLAKSIKAANPGIFESLDEDDQTLMARACWETNRNNEAVRIMLGLGFRVDAPEFNHGYSPLHNAAWDGNTPLVRLLIEHGHPIEVRDPNYNNTPLGFCIYAATEGRCGPNDYAGTVEALLEAGARFDRGGYPTGHVAIDAVLNRKLRL